MPKHPHTEYDDAHDPGKVSVAMEGNGQDIPAKLDFYESLADEGGKDQPREPSYPGVGIPTKTNKFIRVHENMSIRTNFSSSAHQDLHHA